MSTVFGDGRGAEGGFMGKLLGAGKRLITGESLFTTVYSNNASSKQRVAFAAPYPGKILPMDLKQLGGMLICQKDSFLCAARGVSLGIHFQQKLSVGFFGGEGFIMQRLEGDGMAFVHAGGETFQYIPCLNDSPQWIDALADLSERHLQGWNTSAPDTVATQASRERALAAGAKA